MPGKGPIRTGREYSGLMEQTQRKYPIGVQTFSKIREDGYLYIDKTALIYDLVQSGTIYFLSRPRRFGKSLLVTTLESYFSGRKELFRGLAMEGLEKDWTEYPVLHFDFSGTKYFSESALEEQLDLQLSGFESIYGKGEGEISPAGRFGGIIRRAYRQTGRQVVFLVDEYDAPLLDSNSDPELQERLRNMLRSFYSVVKMSDAMLRFVFITGISKFSQMSIFSELNSLQNISMKDRFSAICGITQREVEEQLRPDVEALAQKNGETYEEALEHLKKMYDGYHFSPECEDIYNPFSLLSCLNDRRYSKFWFSSGTPTFLIEMLRKCSFDIETLEGITTSAEQFDVPTEHITNPVPVLYQSGYLTIKDYNFAADLYTLAYPNDEVRLGFINSLIPYYINDVQLTRSSFVYDFTEDLRAGDLDSCMRRITAFFASIPYDLENKTEKHYHTIFYLLFSMMGLYVESEVRSAVGRADIVLKTGTHIYVFELKVDGSAEDALKQIDSKGYLVPYTADGRKLVKVGVNFDSATRTVSDWKAVEE